MGHGHYRKLKLPLRLDVDTHPRKLDHVSWFLYGRVSTSIRVGFSRLRWEVPDPFLLNQIGLVNSPLCSSRSLEEKKELLRPKAYISLLKTFRRLASYIQVII